MKPAIVIQDLAVTIDKKSILAEMGASVTEGRITGLLGPSGSGKTTLIKAILGLQKASRGTITVMGYRPGDKRLRPHTGYVTQSPAVYADLTVLENIRYFAALLGLGMDEARAVLTEVELDGFEGRLVADLSGGERARVSLATALLGRPKVLLLDEPTVGLDPVLRKKLWGVFSDLARQGTTIVITSHVMDEANQCDDLLFLREGRLIAAGITEEVLRRSGADSMEAAFLKLAQGVEA